MHPELRSKAYYAVRMALRDGSLVRPETCSKCSLPKKLDAHHKDYGKPLDVVWLCRLCHAKEPERADPPQSSAFSKNKMSFMITDQAHQMVIEIVLHSIQTTGRGNKSQVVERAIREYYRAIFDETLS